MTELQPGDPLRLGAQVLPGGVGFAVWSPEATQVWLCLFDEAGQREQRRLALWPSAEGVWHGLLPGAGPGLVYGYRASGRWAPQEGLRFNPQRLLLDPYAQAVVGCYGSAPGLPLERLPAVLAAYLDHDPADPARPHPEDNAALALKARVLAPVQAPQPLTPDWPRRAPPPGQRVIAEVHVRSASALHPAVPPALRGSYAALAHPALIAHWQRLGVTTLQLMPLQARADEARLQLMGLRNHWGYTPIGLLAPEPRHAQAPEQAPAALRQAIATLRGAGFEVLLDVVFNHSAETDLQGPCLSFKGLGNRQWYRCDPQQPGRYVDWTGCGNTLNLAEPMVLRWVLDALRHWVQAYGVDGFRFDLAPVLGRDAQGRFSTGAPLWAALQADPLLRRCLLIAEPWDLGPEGHQLGHFPPGWLEWNDQARDSWRAYWLRPGDARGSRAALASRLAGSAERFGADPRHPRAPSASLNFITAHDGFTLRDLVSYNERHNLANGEHNRDGHGDNLSWNAGQEGPSDDAQIQATRAALQRALLATLLLARGTPMLLMGDELGHSQQGNNNAYCQDNPLTWLAWDGPDAPALTAFIGRLTALRRADPALHADNWWTGESGADGLADVAWAGPDGAPLQAADWHDLAQRGLRVLLAPATAAHCTLLLFNPAQAPQRFALPAHHRGGAWRPLLDSSTPDGAPAAHAGDLVPGACTLPPRCVQLWCSASLVLDLHPQASPISTMMNPKTNGD